MYEYDSESVEIHSYDALILVSLFAASSSDESTI